MNNRPLPPQIVHAFSVVDQEIREACINGRGKLNPSERTCLLEIMNGKRHVKYPMLSKVTVLTPYFVSLGRALVIVKSETEKRKYQKMRDDVYFKYKLLEHEIYAECDVRGPCFVVTWREFNKIGRFETQFRLIMYSSKLNLRWDRITWDATRVEFD